MRAAAIATLVGASAGTATRDCATAQSMANEPRLDVAAAFGGAMRPWIVKYGVQRASIAVMRDNRLVFAAGYGGRRANERMAVWSLSKPITALCIATLVKDKKLRLDDPIGPLLTPVLEKSGRAGNEDIARATVAQLLSHRSGLPRDAKGSDFDVAIRQILRDWPLRRATAKMLVMAPAMKLALAGPPDTEFRYSNVGYLLLGQIIQSLTGRPYEVACGERVLAKAGIKDPSLDPEWGQLLQAAGGWSLSGPEYLGFARLLASGREGELPPRIRAVLESPYGRPTSNHSIFHGGSWHWHQKDAVGGPISEERGTWFRLTSAGVAWFASFDGIHIGIQPRARIELDAALERARQSVSSWPEKDDFPNMSVAPMSRQ